MNEFSSLFVERIMFSLSLLPSYLATLGPRPSRTDRHLSARYFSITGTASSRARTYGPLLLSHTELTASSHDAHLTRVNSRVYPPSPSRTHSGLGSAVVSR